MKKINLLFALILICIIADAQPYPVINNHRPRIYADSTRFAWLQNNITVAGDCQTTYIEFDYRYNNWWINDPQLYLTGSDSTQWTWNWGSTYAKDEAVFAIFMFKLNQDSLALKRCRFLAQKTIDTLQAADYSSMAFYDKENFVRKFSDVGSLLIDWCYDDLPDTMLHQLVRAQYSMNREFMNFFILSAFGNSYVSSHNAWNCVYTNQNTLALYNAAGLTVAQNDTVNQWYEAVYDKWINGFLPCYGHYRDDDGGWNWGAAYSMWSLVDQFQMFDNMFIGTDKNFYADLPWVQNSINQYWYFIQPDEWCIHQGDGKTFIAGDRVIYRHAALFNDPRSIWQAQKYSTPQYYYSTPYVFQKLLYKDFTIPVIAQPNLPLDWWSDKTGLSVSRTAWDSTSVMTTFFNSPSKRAAHEHRDNNSFTVFKNKPLLIDAGSYDTYAGTHYRNYYQRTIAHNSICVFDSTDVYTNFGQPASNDGGQIESFALQNYNDIFLPQNQRGTWIKYGTGGNYQYNIADAQLSYDTTKLDFFRRRFLFVKPDRIIVLDNIHLKNIATHQRDAKWIAHFVNQPSINGGVISTDVPGHIETYSGKDYVSVNGNGSIAVRTLLPYSTTTTLIGGSGYEYWVNDSNYAPINPPDTVHGTPGKWRIEVEPVLVTDTLIFLHSIHVGDSINMATTGGTAYQNNFSVGADWNDTLFYFSSYGDTGIVYHFFDSIPGGRTVGVFATDLQTGNYFIKVDWINTASVSTDTNGIIQTSVLLASGFHTVEIVQNFTSVFAIDKSKESIAVFPNPFTAETTLKSTRKFKNATLVIYDLLGREKMKVNNLSGNEFKITRENLSAGFYFIRLTENSRMIATTKIIITD